LSLVPYETNQYTLWAERGNFNVKSGGTYVQQAWRLQGEGEEKTNRWHKYRCLFTLS